MRHPQLIGQEIIDFRVGFSVVNVLNSRYEIEFGPYTEHVQNPKRLAPVRHGTQTGGITLSARPLEKS